MRLIDADALMPNAEYKGRYDVVTAYDIANAPTIESEPRKKGKWIDTGSGQECSECHEIQYGYDNFRYFCAFCGADMREGEEK